MHFKAQNRPDYAPIIRQYNNDTDMAVILFDRHTSAGIDLSTLNVGIITNNGEDTDRIIQLANTDTITVEVSEEEKIKVHWKIGLNTTVKSGVVRFMVTFVDNENALVWQSGAYYLQVDPTLSADEIVAKYPSLLMQYETAMRKLYADSDEILDQAQIEVDKATSQADRSKAEADQAKLSSTSALESAQNADRSAKQAATDLSEVVIIKEQIDSIKVDMISAQDDVTQKHTEVITATETAVSSAASSTTAMVDANESKQAALESAVEAADQAHVSKAEANRAQQIASDFETKTILAAVQTLALEGQKQVSLAKDQANTAKGEADRAKGIADHFETTTLLASIEQVKTEGQKQVDAAAIQAANAKESADEIKSTIDDKVNPLLLTNTVSGQGSVACPMSAPHELQSLKISGATTQVGIPTPNHPVYPKSVGDSGTLDLYIHGENRLRYEQSNTITLDQPLLSFSNGTTDTINFVDGHGIRRIKKLTSLSSTEWRVMKNYTNQLVVATGNDDISLSSVVLLSSHFPFLGYAYMNETNGNYICGSSVNIDVIIGIQKALLPTPDLAGFKTWLSNNAVDVWYISKSPKTIQIPSINLRSYHNTTNITAHGAAGEPMPTIETQYVQDPNLVMDELTLDYAEQFIDIEARLAQLEIQS